MLCRYIKPSNTNKSIFLLNFIFGDLYFRKSPFSCFGFRSNVIIPHPRYCLPTTKISSYRTITSVTNLTRYSSRGTHSYYCKEFKKEMPKEPNVKKASSQLRHTPLGKVIDDAAETTVKSKVRTSSVTSKMVI